jgi:hypothetical protein
MPRSAAPFLLALLAATALSTTVRAQAIDVAVRDAGDAPVAAVAVEIVNQATGRTIRVQTDAAGKALFGALPPGNRFAVRLGGDAATETFVTTRANFTASVTLRTAPRALEEIVVRGARAVGGLNLSNAEVSSSFDASTLAALPVEARDLSTVLFRLPNVTQATGFFPEAPAVSVNGANSLFTQYLIEGLDNNENFLGGQKFPTPLGMVREVTVLSGNYGVEYGRTANGIVNVTTKAGGNDVEGELFFLWRPGAALDSKTDFPTRDLSGNAVRSGFKRFQGGASIGGPLVKDRTFFFVNAELTRDKKNNRLTVPALGVDETIPGDNRFDYFTLRLDQVWNDEWSSTLRAHRGDVEIERQGGGLEGGFTFPSAGDVQMRRSHIAAFQTRYAGERLAYVGDVQFSAFDWNYGKPNNAGPQVTILSPLEQTIGVVGNNGFAFDEEERTWSTKHKVTTRIGAVRVNAGFDILRADFSLAGGGNPAGNYTVRLSDAQLAQVRALNRGAALAVSDIPRGATVLDYAVELRPARFGTSQTLYAGWGEAEFDVGANLTLRGGLRYDYDDLTEKGSGKGDTNNIAPRASFTWRTGEKSALRGGVGIFTEKLPYVVVSDALQRNSDTPGFRAQLQQLVARGLLPPDTDIDRIVADGNATVNLSNVALLEGPSGAALQSRRATLTASERQILNPFGYKNPQAAQASLGYQQEIAPGWLVDGNLLYSRGRNLVRLIDVNGPAAYAGITAEQARSLSPAQLRALVRTSAAADATRPVATPPGGARSVLISDTGGRSKYRALSVTLTKEPREDVYGFRISYTLSKLENDTDDINFRAQDANHFAAEWGPSLNDRRHAISAALFLTPLEGLTVTVAGLFQSGQPINYGPDARIYGTTDLNGDGRSFTNQYTGNPDRAPGFTRNSGRLPWSKTVDLGLRYALAAPGGTVELSADIFNLFNARNLSGYSVNATASNQFQIAGQAFTTRSAAPPRTFQFGVRYLF